MVIYVAELRDSCILSTMFIIAPNKTKNHTWIGERSRSSIDFNSQPTHVDSFKMLMFFDSCSVMPQGVSLRVLCVNWFLITSSLISGAKFLLYRLANTLLQRKHTHTHFLFYRFRLITFSSYWVLTFFDSFRLISTCIPSSQYMDIKDLLFSFSFLFIRESARAVCLEVCTGFNCVFTFAFLRLFISDCLLSIWAYE